MWESFVAGSSHARTIDVSKELYEAAKEYCDRTAISFQFLFESGLYDLIRIWGGGKPSLESYDEECLQKVKQILRNNPMPGKVDWNERDFHVCIKISSDRTYQWMVNLESLAIIPSFSDAVRRIMTWALKNEGYFKKTSE